MIGGARHGDDDEGLEQHRQREGVHCEGSRVDLMAEELKDALRATGVGRVLAESKRRLDAAGPTWLAVVVSEDCSGRVSGKVF